MMKIVSHFTYFPLYRPDMPREEVFRKGTHDVIEVIGNQDADAYKRPSQRLWHVFILISLMP